MRGLDDFGKRLRRPHELRHGLGESRRPERLGRRHDFAPEHEHRRGLADNPGLFVQHLLYHLVRDLELGPVDGEERVPVLVEGLGLLAEVSGVAHSHGPGVVHHQEGVGVYFQLVARARYGARHRGGDAYHVGSDLVAVGRRLLDEVADGEPGRDAAAVRRYLENGFFAVLELAEERVDLDGGDVLERLPVRVDVNDRTGYEKCLHIPYSVGSVSSSGVGSGSGSGVGS